MKNVILTSNQILTEKGFNSRKVFDKNSLQELAGSIKEHGILQPIIVSPMNGGEEKFRLVAGERRFKAGKIAGLKEFPCIVKVLTDRQALEVMTIENLQRKDLTPIEQADGINRILVSGITPEEAAQKIGVSVAFVYKRNKLNFLIPYWKKCLSYNGISLTDANKIARLPKDSQKLIKGNLEGSHHIHKKGGKSYYHSSSIDQAIDNLSNDLALAPFSLADKTIYKKAGSCVDCIKRSACNQQLFDNDNSDICLDAKCYQTKLGNFLQVSFDKIKEKTKTEPVRITHKYWSNDNDILCAGHYFKAKKSDKDSIPAVYADGKNAGKLQYIIKVNSNGSGPLTEGQKEERRKQIRKNKIERQSQVLAVKAIADTFHKHFCDTGLPHNEIMNHLIISIIGYGQSKEFIQYFSERYNWGLGVEYNDQNRRELIAKNIRNTPEDLKFKLFIDAHYKFSTVSQFSTEAMGLAQSIKEIDMGKIKKQATKMVNIKKGRKKPVTKPIREGK